jgi:hypothetical protein
MFVFFFRAGGVDAEEWEPVPIILCHGQCCGIEVTGHYFFGCMMSHREYQLPALANVANKKACWYVDRPIETMTPGLKRFCYYYYYATTCLQAHDRIVLPNCVIAAIRAAHPNEKGDPYSSTLAPFN